MKSPVKAAEPSQKTGSKHFEIEADPFLDEGESAPNSLPGTSIIYKEEKFQDLSNPNVPSLVGNLSANPTFSDEVKVVKLGEKKKKKKGMKASAQVFPVDDNNGVAASSKDGDTAPLTSVQVAKVDEEEAGFHKQQQEKQIEERHQYESSKKRYAYIKYFIGGALCVLLGVGLVFLVQSTSSSSTTTSAQGVVAIGNGNNSSSSADSALAGSSGGTSASPSPISPKAIFGTTGNNTSSTPPKSQPPTNSSLSDSFYTTEAYQMAVLAGSSQGNEGFSDAAGKKALLHFPVGLCVDSSSLSSGGVTWVADSENNVIRRVDSLGVVQTVAGSLKPGSQDGQHENAGFAWPTSVATDFRRETIRSVKCIGRVLSQTLPTNFIESSSFFVSTIAGGVVPGSKNGFGTLASFYMPIGLARDISGTIYVADRLNNHIRQINESGFVSTLAGSTIQGARDGIGAGASFHYPSSVAASIDFTVYVADYVNGLIRVIKPGGNVTALAGRNGIGSNDGARSNASFNRPSGLALDFLGRKLLVSDNYNNIIRSVDISSGAVTKIAGSRTISSRPLFGLLNPTGLATNHFGNIYVSDSANNMIRILYSLQPEISNATSPLSITWSATVPATFWNIGPVYMPYLMIYDYVGKPIANV